MFGKSTASRNNGRTISWRNQYLYQVRDLAKLVADTLPETINFPITGRKTAFELGGSAKNFGNAVIISDGFGYPCQGKLLPKMFPNGLHAEVDVFPCCLIGIASYKLGREVLAIYKIDKIIDSETAESFGYAEAKLVAYLKSPTQFSGSSKKNWFDNLKNEYWTIENFASALYSKLYTVNCTSPFYVEWFFNLKNQLMMRRKFFSDDIKWLSSGICDNNAVTADMSNSFGDLYNSVVSRAMELSKNEKNRIIVAVFGHYFAKINNDDNIEFITNYSDVDFTKCSLITEARLITAEAYDPSLKFEKDHIVFTYAHTFDETVSAVDESGNINPRYFVSDPTFVEFSKKHPLAYVNCILDRRCYFDIISNLNPQPRLLTTRNGEPILDENGEKQYSIPEERFHPDTQTNALLFISSTRAFFTDLKEKFTKKSVSGMKEEVEESAPTSIDFSALSNLTNK